MVDEIRTENRQAPSHSRLLVLGPIVVGVAVFALALLLRQAFVLQQERQAMARMRLVASSVRDKVESQFEAEVAALVRAARRWERAGRTPRSEWEQDIQSYYRDIAVFQAIEWVDERFIVRWVVPVAGNEAALGLNLATEDRRRMALEAARDDQRVTVTKSVALVQGGLGFLVYVPLFVDGRFDGFILGVFRVEKFFKTHLDPVLVTDYSVVVLEGDSEIYRSHESWDEALYPVEVNLDLRGTKWRVAVRPVDPHFLSSILPDLAVGGEPFWLCFWPSCSGPTRPLELGHG